MLFVTTFNYRCKFNHFRGAFISMSVVEGLKIQIHVCGTYVLSVWFTLLIGFGSVWIFSRKLFKTLFKDLESLVLIKTFSSGSRVSRMTYSF